MENRRRAERQSALWMGRCHIEDEPSDLWRECTIIDVSTFGVGIDLCHPDPVELLGLWQEGVLRLHVDRRITVRLESGPSVDTTVAGEVRNAGSRPGGIVRAGIELVGLAETERSVIDPAKRRALPQVHLRLRRVRSLLSGRMAVNPRKPMTGSNGLAEPAPMRCDNEQASGCAEAASCDHDSELVSLGGAERNHL